jgi:16S rRNA (guanine527-N7)-methyltransferase
MSGLQLPHQLEVIHGYFPELTSTQLNQFKHLDYLFRYWNQRINLISRQDIDYLYAHHVMHSLAIARFIQFAPGTRVLDVGTGGGFPGIPLAIFFPNVEFVLVDVIEKKIRAVDVMYRALGLRNVTTQRIPVEMLRERFDFAVSRAVADMSTLYRWASPLISSESINDFPNGLIALKGGALDTEIREFRNQLYQFALSDYYRETFFADKYLVYLPAA